MQFTNNTANTLAVCPPNCVSSPTRGCVPPLPTEVAWCAIACLPCIDRARVRAVCYAWRDIVDDPRMAYCPAVSRVALSYGTARVPFTVDPLASAYRVDKHLRRALAAFSRDTRDDIIGRHSEQSQAVLERIERQLANVARLMGARSYRTRCVGHAVTRSSQRSSEWEHAPCARRLWAAGIFAAEASRALGQALTLIAMREQRSWYGARLAVGTIDEILVRQVAHTARRRVERAIASKLSLPREHTNGDIHYAIDDNTNIITTEKKNESRGDAKHTAANRSGCKDARFAHLARWDLWTQIDTMVLRDANTLTCVVGEPTAARRVVDALCRRSAALGLNDVCIADECMHERHASACHTYVDLKHNSTRDHLVGIYAHLLRPHETYCATSRCLLLCGPVGASTQAAAMGVYYAPTCFDLLCHTRAQSLAQNIVFRIYSGSLIVRWVFATDDTSLADLRELASGSATTHDIGLDAIIPACLAILNAARHDNDDDDTGATARPPKRTKLSPRCTLDPGSDNPNPSNDVGKQSSDRQQTDNCAHSTSGRQTNDMPLLVWESRAQSHWHEPLLTHLSDIDPCWPQPPTSGLMSSPDAMGVHTPDTHDGDTDHEQDTKHVASNAMKLLVLARTETGLSDYDTSWLDRVP